MYTHVYNIYIYIYIYYLFICLYLVRHGNRQDGFYGFRRRHHPTFFNGSVVVFLWFPLWQENVFCSNGFRACSSKRDNSRFVTNSRLRWGHIGAQ